MISVKCPHCHVGLKVDEGKIPLDITSFKCPKCKQPIPVSLLSMEKGKSNASTATIGIVTADKSMSREHIRIEVKKDAKGGYKHYLSDNNSKNHTLYNSNYLENGEIVILNNNDEMNKICLCYEYNDRQTLGSQRKRRQVE